VLSDFKREFPDLDTLHVMSDGPVTQYRGRGNLHLLSNVPYDLGYKFVFWNFSEASHGKGAADGVGAAVKRLCDNLALSGLDLTNASSVCSAITGLSKTKIYEILSDFNGSGICLPDKQIPPVTGIMKVHQIISYKREIIYTRDVSCYCSDRKVCRCFHPVQRCVLSARSAMNELLESEVLKHVLPQVTEQWALVREQPSALIPEQSEHSTLVIVTEQSEHSSLVTKQPLALVPEQSEHSTLVAEQP